MTLKKVGIVTIVLGIGMFVFGASMFTYQGPPISTFVSNLAKYSFLLWLPVLLTGIIITGIGADDK